MKYDGDISAIKVTEPTVVEYELIVLQTYRKFVEHLLNVRGIE